MTAAFASPDITPKPVDEQLVVNGRYKIPDPVTGKSRMWTRATTFAKTMADNYHLDLWKQRNVACGLVLSPDLYALVGAAMPADMADQTSEERSKLNDLCRDASKAAGSAKGSNLGTALHSFTDAVDSGRRAHIPAPWNADVAAYQATMRLHDIGIDPQWVEKVITCDRYNVAGKFDRILNYKGRPTIGDLKTAKSLDLGWGEIAIQLALYAHADTIFDPGTGTHRPMPEVDHDVALVMHLPVGKAECVIYKVDIAAGWEAAELAAGVRNWRKRSDLAQQINAITKTDDAPVHISTPLAAVVDNLVVVADPFEGLPTADGDRADLTKKRDWLLERRAVLIDIPGGREALARNWPAGVPTLVATDTHTGGQLLQIQNALSAAEAEVLAPFPEHEDPTDPAVMAVANDDPRVVDLIDRLKKLPPDLLAAVESLTKKAQVPSLSRGRLTEAHLQVVEPLVAAAETEYAPRATRISNALAVAAERAVSEQALLAVLGVDSVRRIHGPLVGHLDTLADAVGLNLLVERDGVIVVDTPASILGAEPYRDSRKAVLDAGREIARTHGFESPKDSDACLSHPLIAAYLAAM